MAHDSVFHEAPGPWQPLPAPAAFYISVPRVDDEYDRRWVRHLEYAPGGLKWRWSSPHVYP